MKPGTTIEVKGDKKISPFEQQWGEPVTAIAEREGVLPETIYMRVQNYGTPYQRRDKPTACELMYGKTQYQIALEEGVTHLTILSRLRRTSSAYQEKKHHMAGKTRGGVNHFEQGQVTQKTNGWLMPEHPEYNTWRYKYIKKLLGDSNED